MLVLAATGLACSESEEPAPISRASPRPEPAAPEVAASSESVEAAPAPVARFESSKLKWGARLEGDAVVVRARLRKPASRLRLPALNPIDQRLVLLVTDARRVRGTGWLRVLLPERPNGSKGWVRRSDVRLVRLRQRIEVDLSKRRLVHFKGGKRVNRFTIAIGSSTYPTPAGPVYVWARVPQPSANGAYGVYALGLSAFSPVLSDWPGGGRAAVHGTANPYDKGAAVSHGCVRVFNPDMRKLTSVPMGTPVVIRR